MKPIDQAHSCSMHFQNCFSPKQSDIFSKKLFHQFDLFLYRDLFQLQFSIFIAAFCQFIVSQMCTCKIFKIDFLENKSLYVKIVIYALFVELISPQLWNALRNILGTKVLVRERLILHLFPFILIFLHKPAALLPHCVFFINF